MILFITLNKNFKVPLFSKFRTDQLMNFSNTAMCNYMYINIQVSKLTCIADTSGIINGILYLAL